MLSFIDKADFLDVVTLTIAAQVPYMVVDEASYLLQAPKERIQ